MKRFLLSIISTLGLSASASGGDNVPREGECWSYRSRPGEDRSYIAIRKIEIAPGLGEIIHISVFGLRIPSHSSSSGFAEEAAHIPIAAENFRASILKRLDIAAPKEPDWKEGYQMWRKDFDSGNAGVFTIPIAECVSVVEEAIQRAP